MLAVPGAGVATPSTRVAPWMVMPPFVAVTGPLRSRPLREPVPAAWAENTMSPATVERTKLLMTTACPVEAA